VISGSHPQFRLTAVLALITALRLALLPALSGTPCQAQTPASLRADALYLQFASEAVRGGRQFLERSQLEDGSYHADGFLLQSVTVTSAATLALLRSGSTQTDPVVAKSLNFLRTLPEESLTRTHDQALLLAVLAGAQDQADLPRCQRLANALIQSQQANGGWPHRAGDTDGDLSAAEFALLGLQAAVQNGISVPPEVWQLAAGYWKSMQLADGSWPMLMTTAQQLQSGSQSGPQAGTVSGTMAGIAMLQLCERQAHRNAGNFAGPRDCCAGPAASPELITGKRWLQTSLTASERPAAGASPEVDHLYGLERSGRMFGLLFPEEDDWYRTGAVRLLERQHRSQGFWPGNHQVLATSYAILYITTGVAPSMINRLELTSSRHLADSHLAPNDLWQLTGQFAQVRKFPGWLRPAQVPLAQISDRGRLKDPRLQVPVLLLTASQAPVLNDSELRLLREYLEQGGLIFAAPQCAPEEFEAGLQTLIEQLFDSEARLEPLPAFHPVFQVPCPLEPASLPLMGVHSGCRLKLIYSRNDCSCAWSTAGADPAAETTATQQALTRLGINVLSYAAGSTWKPQLAESSTPSLSGPPPGQGTLRVGLVRHAGGWNAAGGGLPRLLRGVNELLGPIADPQAAQVVLDDPKLYEFPVLFLHGTRAFKLSPAEIQGLRLSLQRGGILIADACCHSREFDSSFRELVSQLFPHHPLAAVPAEHELFTEETAFDVRELTWQKISPSENSSGGSSSDGSSSGEAGGGKQVQQPALSRVRPECLGVQHEGRLVILYSPVDLSCAWEGQHPRDCDGYLDADAMKLGVNLFAYALLQDWHSQHPAP